MVQHVDVLGELVVGSTRPPRPGTHDAQLAEWYRLLDLNAGADMPQIKTSYRQLMRKYHPDMHAGNPGQAEGRDRALDACNSRV